MVVIRVATAMPRHLVSEVGRAIAIAKTHQAFECIQHALRKTADRELLEQRFTVCSVGCRRLTRRFPHEVAWLSDRVRTCLSRARGMSRRARSAGRSGLQR